MSEKNIKKRRKKKKTKDRLKELREEWKEKKRLDAEEKIQEFENLLDRWVKRGIIA